MTDIEFAEKSKDLREQHLKAMCKDLEAMWGQRVHVGAAVVLIDNAGHPQCVLFSDTMAGEAAMSGLMATCWGEKYEADIAMKPPIGEMN